MATQKIPGRAIKLGTDTAGDVTYFDGDAWRRLPIGEAGEVLTMNTAGTFPEWGAAQCPWNQGVLRGYSSGGNSGLHTTTSRYSRIDNYSFVTDGDATDWGDLIRDNYQLAGTASATHGYAMAGEHTINPYPGQVAVYDDHIQKFSFAAQADATNVSDSSLAHDHGTGHSDGTNGYNCYVLGWPLTSTIVDKFPFATDTDATDVGDCNVNQNPNGGMSSCTHGYYGTEPGIPNGALAGNINQFSFANAATATDVGDVIVNPQSMGCSMSETHGYFSGGSGNNNQIQKFSFATHGNATDVGDLNHGGTAPSCSSSTTHNYNTGGWQGEQNPSNVIDKWSTANDVDATGVGTLWAVNYGACGSQV